MDQAITDAVFTALVSIVPLVIAFFGNEARKWLKARLAPAQFDLVLNLARTCITAAEEVGRATGSDGPDKYEYAENALITAAKRGGMHLEPSEANAFIHAALTELRAVLDDNAVRQAAA
jgi:hypothetical protein